ncbi:MAG: WbqC family protein [Bacteroidales bacterium]|nr:WbqC family protein [Bacteroidales bacterium]MBR5027630.1 WbqC family protein [Bacteroidales bacterium]
MPLFSTAYFPCTAYMAALAAYPSAMVEAFETYPKQTYRNRTVIATSNGLLPLTVNVTKPNGNHTLTKDITICRKENWPMQHWRAIESAYNASPYFLYYSDDIRRFILGNHKFLLDLNMEILSYIIGKLKLTTKITLTTGFVSPAEATDDYRNYFSPKNKNNRFDDMLPYPQVFDEKNSFFPNISVLDLLFNLGPECSLYLAQAETAK